jgi:hypothetical protein
MPATILGVAGIAPGTRVYDHAQPYVWVRALTFIPAIIATVGFSAFRGSVALPPSSLPRTLILLPPLAWAKIAGDARFVPSRFCVSSGAERGAARRWAHPRCKHLRSNLAAALALLSSTTKPFG